MLDEYLGNTGQYPDQQVTDCPKAIIAPHAGYVYSGEIAGKAYQLVASARARIKRVILLGPSHRVAFRGMAVPTANVFKTPLGNIAVDSQAIQQIVGMPSVGFLEEAHTEEHSLEVHLPFLQRVIDDFTLVPIVVGDVNKEEVAAVLEALWGGPETLIVISSDLSHYEPYEKARELDAHTAHKIATLNPTLKGSEACGCRPVNGLLHYLKLHHLTIDAIDIRNSGDTAGDKSRVVGYGAWQVKEANTLQNEWSLAERQLMLQVAREAIRSPLEGEKNYNINLDLYPEHLRKELACFITLNIGGQLRGCIGSLQAHRPLVLDIANNAQAAAFKDPRFSPLTHKEYWQTDIHISVLSEPAPLPVTSREDLEAKLRPGTDGLIIRESGRQATYLPSVWEQLPTPQQFVTELRKKAGLKGDGWTGETEVFIYTTEEFS
jgi:AmmeMemoRadiSam system protein B/AmmeMemoRadiSam system protein A